MNYLIKTKMLFISSVIIAVTLVLSACSATGPIFQQVKPLEEKALVYFYREVNHIGSISSCIISSNNSLLGELNNGGYFSSYTQPGITKIDGKIGVYDLAITVNFEAGKTYYIHCGAHATSNHYVFTLNIVDERIGASQIKDNKNQKAER